MNGSVGADFKERASAERTARIRYQDRQASASSLTGQARIIRAAYTGHANQALRQDAIAAASKLDDAAHAIRMLAATEQADFNASQQEG